MDGSKEMSPAITENVNKGRIQWIDALKGFAILLVVFAHVAERYYKFDLVPTATHMFKTIYNVVYSFHMPLFFIISGFLFQLYYMTPSWEEKKDRFCKHWVNLAIVYTVFSLLLGGGEAGIFRRFASSSNWCGFGIDMVKTYWSYVVLVCTSTALYLVYATKECARGGFDYWKCNFMFSKYIHRGFMV